MKSKKAQTFSMGLNLIVLIFLIWVYVNLAGKQTATTKTGQTGDNAAILMSMNSMTDQAQLFAEDAAALAAETALSELARRGGMAETDNCGIINGYSKWNTPDKTIFECYPDPVKSIQSHFLTSFNNILGTYTSPSGDLPDARRKFDTSVTRTNDEMILAATTPQPLYLSIKKKNGDTIATAGTYLSASTKIPDISSELASIRDNAQKILDKCGDTTKPFECASDQVYHLNTAPGAQMKWKAGPCPGDLAPTDPRIVQFCVQSDRRMLTRKTTPKGTTMAFTPTLYRFALTITKKSPVKIINFQANGKPDTGKPTDKAGMGLLTGQPIAYHARLSSPSLDGLLVSLCQTEEVGNKKTCQQIPTAQWIVDTYPATQQLSVSGTWQPTVTPPFTLTLEAERKEQKDTTAGIDIVTISP